LFFHNHKICIGAKCISYIENAIGHEVFAYYLQFPGLVTLLQPKEPGGDNKEKQLVAVPEDSLQQEVECVSNQMLQTMSALSKA